MSAGEQIHESNVESMRVAFLREVDKAAPRDERTTYIQWDDAVQGYLKSLRPWLTDDDLLLVGRPEFCVLPGSSLPFSVYGYGYFRAWLRKRNLDPEDFRPTRPPPHLRDVA